jgi:mono/diheme cytochrome c family protein
MVGRMRFALSLAAVVCVVVVVSCAANNETLKKAFAPDFGAATEAQLQDGMWRLGYATQDLDAAIKAEGVSEDDRHAAIMETLNLMADAAASVGKPGQQQKHTNVAMNLPKLTEDIEAARAAAASRDYTLAKALPQSCLACHVGGGGGPQKQ